MNGCWRFIIIVRQKFKCTIRTIAAHSLVEIWRNTHEALKRVQKQKLLSLQTIAIDNGIPCHNWRLIIIYLQTVTARKQKREGVGSSAILLSNQFASQASTTNSIKVCCHQFSSLFIHTFCCLFVYGFFFCECNISRMHIDLTYIMILNIDIIELK